MAIKLTCITISPEEMIHVKSQLTENHIRSAMIGEDRLLIHDKDISAVISIMWNHKIQYLMEEVVGL